MSPEGLSLRLSLIVLGIAIVIGVYLFTSFKKKRENRRHFERDFSRIDLADVILKDDMKDGHPDVGMPPSKNEHSNTTGISRKNLREDLPQIRNDIPASGTPPQTTDKEEKEQLDLFSLDLRHPEIEPKKNTPLRELESDSVANETGLINLFVESKGNASFSGTEIVKHLNAVGMRHGEMSIFHLYEESTNNTETVLFSAANMYEPGTFDLNLMDSFETKGIVFFMQIGALRDNETILTQLLETARSFSSSIDGSLNAKPGILLDEYEILKFRRTVAT